MRRIGGTLHWIVPLLILALLGSEITVWAAAQDRNLYLSAKKDYEVLRKAKPAAENRARWEQLAGRFGKIAQDFPRGQSADDALYLAGKIYQELSRSGEKERALGLAIKTWRALVSKYPKSPFVPEAQYWMAVDFEEGKGDAAEARKQYQELIRKYPKGDWAAKARKRLDGLAKKAEAEMKGPPLASTGQTGKAVLSQIRHTSSSSYTRVIMELSTEVAYKTHVLKDDLSKGLPPRIYVDLVGARLGIDSAQPIPIQNGLLRQVRVGQFSPDVVRVVLDMSSLSDFQAFLLPDPYRLVIDIQGQKNGAKPAAVEARKDSLPLPKDKKPLIAGVRKIVLDPGHGGKDPGAIGVDGIAEKEIVLGVAKKLAQKLKKDMGVEVVLTRKDDTFIALEDRTAIANTQDADLFISLHVNASPNPAAKGIETYYLDNTNDEAAMRLAARENGISRNSISDVQFILSDLTQNLKLEDSITLAHRLHTSVVSQMGRRYGEVRDLGVKKALFYVLVGARMPSILVELFFVTNKTEGHALAKESYQESLAEALYEGIKRYQENAQVVRNL